MNKNKTFIYELTSEDISSLGSPMGTEQTWENWSKLYLSAHSAKKAAEKDYKNKIKWVKEKGGWTSGDLRYVMYNIVKREVLE